MTEFPRPRSRHISLSLAGAALLVGVACTNLEPAASGDPSTQSACCDCTCSDGTDVCMNIVSDAPAGVTCEEQCASQCGAQEGCTEVDAAEICPGEDPRPCAHGSSFGADNEPDTTNCDPGIDPAQS